MRRGGTPQHIPAFKDAYPTLPGLLGWWGFATYAAGHTSNADAVSAVGAVTAMQTPTTCTHFNIHFSHAAPPYAPVHPFAAPPPLSPPRLELR